MSTTTTTSTTDTYRIVTDDGFYLVEGPFGLLLRDQDGRVRKFISRSAARKRISRERSGNFHK